jgi:hypothetical protein
MTPIMAALLVFGIRFVETFICEIRTYVMIERRAGLAAFLAGVEDILNWAVLGTVLVAAQAEEGGFLQRRLGGGGVRRLGLAGCRLGPA